MGLFPEKPLAEAFSPPLVIEDALKNKSVFTSPPKRIVALYGALNEILLALGARDAIAARTKADEAIAAIKSLPSIGTHMRPNPELIMAQAPDLILQLKGRGEAGRDLDVFRERGINVLALSIESFADLFDVTLKLGRILNKEEKAAELVRGWKERLDALSKKMRNERPKVFYEARHPNLLTAGSAGMVNEIIKAAGGKNVIDLPKKLVRVSEEILYTKDPDAYVIQKGPMNPNASGLKERDGFKNLRAAEKVLIVDELKFARPGPGSVEAAELLHDFLYEDKR